MFFGEFFLLCSHIKNKRYSRAAKVEPRSNQKTVEEGARGGNTSDFSSNILQLFRLRPWVFVRFRMNPRPPQDTSRLQARQVMDRLVMDVNTVQ